jgi:tetratricopeptide (TPR) repeat protein
MDGVNSYRAFYNIGVIYECLGKTEEAIKYYEKCGDYRLAKSRLEFFL